MLNIKIWKYKILFLIAVNFYPGSTFGFLEFFQFKNLL